MHDGQDELRNVILRAHCNAATATATFIPVTDPPRSQQPVNPDDCRVTDPSDESSPTPELPQDCEMKWRRPPLNLPRPPPRHMTPPGTC